MHWYLSVVKKYAVCTGRAGRSEFWSFLCCHLLISIGLALLDHSFMLYDPNLGVGWLGAGYAVVLGLPFLAVVVRRLHDGTRSAWLLLLMLVPVIGALLLLLLLALPGTRGPNRYGAEPVAPGS